MILNWQNTAPEIQAGAPQVAILPLACLEPLVPHLPLGTHQFIVSELARRLAADYPLPAFLLPTWPLGTRMLPAGQAGAISLEYATLWAVVRDIVESMVAHAIRRVVVINDLGSLAAPSALPAGNPIVKTAVRQLNYETPGLTAIWVQPFAAGREALQVLFPAAGLTLGVVEQAILMHLDPSLVPNAADGSQGHATAERGCLALDAIAKATIDYIENSFNLLDRMKA